MAYLLDTNTCQRVYADKRLESGKLGLRSYKDMRNNNLIQ